MLTFASIAHSGGSQELGYTERLSVDTIEIYIEVVRTFPNDIVNHIQPYLLKRTPPQMPTTYFIFMGAFGTGKTTVSRALLEQAQRKAPNAQARDATFRYTTNEAPHRRYSTTRFRGARTIYSMIDPWDGFTSVETALLNNKEPADIGIYVVSAELGPRKEDGFALDAFRQLNANRIVLFISHAEKIDRAVVDEVIVAARSFLAQFGFVRGDVKEVVGSAKWALRGRDDGNLGTSAIKQLLHILDNAFP